MPRTGKIYCLSPVISDDLALLLGMFAGDGCLTVKCNGEGYRVYPIGFFNTNKQYVELFSELFFKVFNAKGTITYRDRKGKKRLWGFEKYSVQLYALFRDQLEMPCGKKALSVGIPSFIIGGSASLQMHFFIGLLVTDGSLRKDGDILFHTASERLANDMRRLVWSLWGFDREIRSYVQQGLYKSYQLTLNKQQCSFIMESLPPSHNLVLRRSSLKDERKP